MKEFINSKAGKFISSALIFVIVWTLMDFAWIKLISHGEFAFNVVSHVIMPMIAAVVYTLLEGKFKKK